MAFKIDGRLQRVAVDEGDYVKAGQLIAQLDDHDYLVQLETVQAANNLDEAVLECKLAASSVASADENLRSSRLCFEKGTETIRSPDTLG